MWIGHAPIQLGTIGAKRPMMQQLEQINVHIWIMMGISFPLKKTKQCNNALGFIISSSLGKHFTCIQS